MQVLEPEGEAGLAGARHGKAVEGGGDRRRRARDAGQNARHQAAGQTGNGVIAGAKEAGIFAIGVDANQNHERPGTVLTSMVKRVDVAVVDVLPYAMGRDPIKEQGFQTCLALILARRRRGKKHGWY